MEQDISILHCFRPNDTWWNSLFLSVERIVRIIKDERGGALYELYVCYCRFNISFSWNFLSGGICQNHGSSHQSPQHPSSWDECSDGMTSDYRYCKPLLDAALEGQQKRFKDMMAEPEFIAAATLLQKFKTAWTSDENLLNLKKLNKHIYFYLLRWGLWPGLICLKVKFDVDGPQSLIAQGTFFPPTLFFQIMCFPLSMI